MRGQPSLLGLDYQIPYTFRGIERRTLRRRGEAVLFAGMGALFFGLMATDLLSRRDRDPLLVVADVAFTAVFAVWALSSWLPVAPLRVNDNAFTVSGFTSEKAKGRLFHGRVPFADVASFWVSAISPTQIRLSINHREWRTLSYHIWTGDDASRVGYLILRELRSRVPEREVIKPETESANHQIARWAADYAPSG